MNPSTLSPPLRVLILGAGWLGLPLGEHWAARGAIVTTVRRSDHSPVSGGQALALDLNAMAGADADSAINAWPSAITPLAFDVVVAAVAPDRARGDDHTSTYPMAAKAAVALASASGAKVLAWVSSTGVYGYIDGREVFEDTARMGDGAAHEALCAAEDTVLAAKRHALQVGVFRVAGLYGPERDPASRFRNVQALVGRSSHWLNLAWRDDVISAIEHWTNHALQSESVPSVLNVSDGTPLTVAEAARLVAQADGRAFVPPSDGGVVSAPMRSNQRIRIEALRSLGWSPDVPHLRIGLRKLGYERLAPDAQRYGPQTAAIRDYLRAVAALTPEAHARVLQSWRNTSGSQSFARADRALGEAMVRANREAERDAAAGPLLQMMRTPREPGDAADATAPDLDPIAEPALAGLMALVVRDVLPAEVFDELSRAISSEL
jgi:nucleoside-diphosphate-sugar epimerase